MLGLNGLIGGTWSLLPLQLLLPKFALCASGLEGSNGCVELYSYPWPEYRFDAAGGSEFGNESMR